MTRLPAENEALPLRGAPGNAAGGCGAGPNAAFGLAVPKFAAPMTAAPQVGHIEAPGYRGWPQRAQVVTLSLSFEHPPATAPSAVIFSLSLAAIRTARKNGESLPGRMQNSWASVPPSPHHRNSTGQVGM